MGWGMGASFTPDLEGTGAIHEGGGALAKLDVLLAEIGCLFTRCARLSQKRCNGDLEDISKAPEPHGHSRPFPPSKTHPSKRMENQACFLVR